MPIFAMLLARLQQQRRGQTTVLISHRPQVIGACDWVVMLEQGQLVSQGTPAELRRREGLHRSFLLPEVALVPERLYLGMNITNAIGLTDAQKLTLWELGAID